MSDYLPCPAGCDAGRVAVTVADIWRGNPMVGGSPPEHEETIDCETCHGEGIAPCWRCAEPAVEITPDGPACAACAAGKITRAYWRLYPRSWRTVDAYAPSDRAAGVYGVECVRCGEVRFLLALASDKVLRAAWDHQTRHNVRS